MKSITTSLVLLSVAFISTAQTVTEPFTKIDLSSTGKVFLRQGDSTSVVVNTTGNRDKIRTEVKNGTLVINSKVEAEYNITMKNIEGVSVSGSGEINGETPINADALSLDVSGSGKMTLQLAVKKLNIDISGVGKETLSGTADEAKIDISGSGKIDAYDLKVASVRANISGVGKCNIDVTDYLKTDISGMGTINYKTAPKNMEQNISGMGKINDVKISNDKTEEKEEHDGYDGGKKDTTRFKLGHSEVLIISNDSAKAKHRHKSQSTKPIWAGLEIGFNNYVNASGNADLPAAYNFLDLNIGKSVVVSLNLLQKNIQFGHSNFWFFTGLGLTWNNYRFDKNVVLNPNSLINSTFDTTSTRSYQKSKLAATYLTAPLMFEVFTSHKRKSAFHIGAGGMLGYRIGSHTKLKYDDNGNTSKPKTYDDFNLNPFRYGGRLVIGYGKFNLFGDFFASTLFKNDQHPIMYPIDFGITLVGF
jgi:hypothetical protein